MNTLEERVSAHLHNVATQAIPDFDLDDVVGHERSISMGTLDQPRRSMALVAAVVLVVVGAAGATYAITLSNDSSKRAGGPPATSLHSAPEVQTSTVPETVVDDPTLPDAVDGSTPLSVVGTAIGEKIDPGQRPATCDNDNGEFDRSLCPLWVGAADPSGQFVIGYVKGSEMFAPPPNPPATAEPGGPTIYNEREEPIGRFNPGAVLFNTRPFDLDTHCGIDGATIDGVWWKAKNPLDENGSAPAGWDSPIQAGTLYFTADDQAVFARRDGPWVVLQRAEAEVPTTRCD